MNVGNTISILNLIRMAVEGIHKILSHSHNRGPRRNYFRNRKREERNIGKIIHNLSRDELFYLFQYKQYETTVIAFNRTTPVVQLLITKGLIRPSHFTFDCFDAPAHYKTSNFDDNCRPFELIDMTNKYLLEHPEVFSRIQLE